MSYHGLRASRVSTPESIFNHGIERALNFVLSKSTQQLRVNRPSTTRRTLSAAVALRKDSLRSLPSDRSQRISERCALRSSRGARLAKKGKCRVRVESTPAGWSHVVLTFMFQHFCGDARSLTRSPLSSLYLRLECPYRSRGPDNHRRRKLSIHLRDHRDRCSQLLH